MQSIASTAAANAIASQSATIQAAAIAAANAASTITVSGLSTLGLTVSGTGTYTIITGNGAQIGTVLNVSGAATVSGLTVQNALNVSGAATVSGLTVQNALNVSGAATVSGLTVRNALNVSGAIAQTGNVGISTGTGTVTLNGPTTISGTFLTATGKMRGINPYTANQYPTNTTVGGFPVGTISGYMLNYAVDRDDRGEGVLVNRNNITCSAINTSGPFPIRLNPLLIAGEGGSRVIESVFYSISGVSGDRVFLNSSEHILVPGMIVTVSGAVRNLSGGPFHIADINSGAMRNQIHLSSIPVGSSWGGIPFNIGSGWYDNGALMTASAGVGLVVESSANMGLFVSGKGYGNGADTSLTASGGLILGNYEGSRPGKISTSSGTTGLNITSANGDMNFFGESGGARLTIPQAAGTAVTVSGGLNVNNASGGIILNASGTTISGGSLILRGAPGSLGTLTINPGAGSGGFHLRQTGSGGFNFSNEAGNMTFAVDNPLSQLFFNSFASFQATGQCGTAASTTSGTTFQVSNSNINNATTVVLYSFRGAPPANPVLTVGSGGFYIISGTVASYSWFIPKY